MKIKLPSQLDILKNHDYGRRVSESIQCKGTNCPIKGQCLRYSSSHSHLEVYYLSSPYDEATQHCSQFIKFKDKEEITEEP